MTAIIIIAIIWCICKLICAASRQAKENARQREIKRLWEEQARQRMEQQRQCEALRQRERDAREQARKQAEHDKAIEKARIEREAMRKEQERQAKELSKHEDMIARMKVQMRKADADIDFLTTRIADLDYQLDFQLMTQAAFLPGSKEFEKCQGKIVTLRNQIHTAESRLANAEYKKEQAQRKLA